MKISSMRIAAAAVLAAVSCYAGAGEATVKIKALNLDGRELKYHRTYNGVYLTTFTPIELDADSTYTLTIPAEGVERMMLMATDPADKLDGVFKSFYVLPGITEITVNPFAEDKAAVRPPSGNSLDGDAAQTADKIYDISFDLSIGGHDALGLWADSIPTVASAKLDAYAHSLVSAYAGATPAIREAMERDVRLEALMVFIQCDNRTKGKPYEAAWHKELSRLRDRIGLADTGNARNPFFASQIANDFFYKDNFPDRNLPDISPDSMLSMKMDYFMRVMPGKTAEAAIGTMLYNDGETGIFTPGVPALTERFKTLFPASGLIPMLERKAAENLAFNHPEASDEIVFLDNSSIKTLADLLAPYKGTPVLIDLWATWCRPCRKSFSHVGPVQEYAAENGVQLLYLSIDEQSGIEPQWKRMAQFYKLKGHHMLINPDIKREIYSTFGKNGQLVIPLYAIVDRDGNISICPQKLSESADFAPLRTLLDKAK